MIIDFHSHLMWYPDHISDTTADEALAAKRIKLERSGGLSHQAELSRHVYDSRPEHQWRAAQEADAVVVFGLDARPSGFHVPNDVIADYAQQHPGRIEGWASVNPAEPGALDELEQPRPR